jgi:hypothetical protein
MLDFLMLWEVRDVFWNVYYYWDLRDQFWIVYCNWKVKEQFRISIAIGRWGINVGLSSAFER